MKIALHSTRHPRRADESGVALLMVIVFMAAMASLISMNSQVLHQFKRNVQIMERHQVRNHPHWRSAVLTLNTNSPPTAIASPAPTSEPSADASR